MFKLILMKRVLLLLLAVIALTPSVMAGNKNKKAKAEIKAVAAIDTTAIQWMSLDDVQVAMKKQPRKVYMDVYTDWCGWCKVMEKKTFSNTNVIKYINTNFYAVRLNAEQQDSIRFVGKMYGFSPENRANMFAVELMKGQMSYPTSIFMEENFQSPQMVPGYLDVPTMEKVLKYLGGNIYKTTKFEDFANGFTPTWAGSASPAQGSEVPAAH